MALGEGAGGHGGPSGVRHRGEDGPRHGQGPSVDEGVEVRRGRPAKKSGSNPSQSTRTTYLGSREPKSTAAVAGAITPASTAKAVMVTSAAQPRSL